MAIFGGLIDLGIAFLLAAVFAEYLKFRNVAKKGFNWIILAGVFFLFAGTFPIVGSGSYLGLEVLDTILKSTLGASVWNGLAQLFEILAWLFALVGTLFVVYEAFIEK
ncbi:MAG: hypothetical protein ACP5H3_01715 [Candidatus Aenigmatarchaeota archaeon]